MNIDEAVKQLQDFCRVVENEEIRNYIIQKYGDFGVNTEKYYQATKVLLVEVESLKQENKQLREALKKCSPYVFIRCTPCKFCRIPEGNGHTADCEYIKLTEVQE